MAWRSVVAQYSIWMYKQPPNLRSTADVRVDDPSASSSSDDESEPSSSEKFWQRSKSSKAISGSRGASRPSIQAW